MDGVLPDDQRRGGGFQWPPPKENYVYEALQGAVVQAELLHRRGYDAWNWQNRALLRAFDWLHREAQFPAGNDDTWQPHLVNFRYGSSFPAPTPSSHGKSMGFTDWTHSGPGDAAGCTGDVNGDSVTDGADVAEVLAQWTCQGACAADANGDGTVNIEDLLMVMDGMGTCD